jgi:hypothetical protein
MKGGVEKRRRGEEAPISPRHPFPHFPHPFPHTSFPHIIHFPRNNFPCTHFPHIHFPTSPIPPHITPFPTSPISPHHTFPHITHLPQPISPHHFPTTHFPTTHFPTYSRFFSRCYVQFIKYKLISQREATAPTKHKNNRIRTAVLVVRSGPTNRTARSNFNHYNVRFGGMMWPWTFCFFLGPWLQVNWLFGSRTSQHIAKFENGPSKQLISPIFELRNML